MKKVFIICLVLLLFSSQIFSQKKGNAYLGQTPPGNKPELFAPGIVSSGNHDMDITISPDGNEIFFSRSGSDWFSTILYMKNTDKGWEGPMTLPFKDNTDINYPFISNDGKTLYFESKIKSKVGDGDNRDIFISKKTKEGWNDAIHLENGVNTEYAEMYTSVSSNGTIYFSANYPKSKGRFDLYKFIPNNKAKPEAIQLDTTINSDAAEFHAYIAPDESYIIFDSPREGGFGANDLYISFKKADKTWTKAVNMGEGINTEHSDMRPFVTYDGKYLFFCSTRPNSKIDTNKPNLNIKEFSERISGPGNGSQDIYWVSTSIINKLKEEALDKKY